MNDRDITPELAKVIVALKKAGYDPNDQLTGYLKSGDSSYITRKYGAREIIEKIDKNEIYNYIRKNKVGR